MKARKCSVCTGTLRRDERGICDDCSTEFARQGVVIYTSRDYPSPDRVPTSKPRKARKGGRRS